jgi:5-methyltetrahydropteroyltriglutamate--homocysteine methyltransferase
MATQTRPPFRADHVGSLLRPKELLDAREKAQGGDPASAAQYRKVQEKCVREVVERQQNLGLEVATDGEFFRDWWHVDFLDALDGVDSFAGKAMVGFQGSIQPLALKVSGKVKRSKPIFVDHFKYTKSVCKVTPKITIPAPAMLYHRVGREAISEEAYPDLNELWNDVATAYREEIRDLYAAGCRYLQIDDVSYSYLCDASYRETFRKRGEDPDKLLRTYANAINMSIAERPKDMTVGIHTCRGNFVSTWAASGGYEPVAEVLFNEINVDGYFLEFDTDRAGGFEPLRHVPKGKKIVLGLVTTKTPDLEPMDVLKRRVDEAAKYVDPEFLCLSPQCGFSSTHHGNKISMDDQWRKLELVVKTADRLWG